MKKYQSGIRRERLNAPERNMDREFFQTLLNGARGRHSPYWSEAQSRINEDSAMSLTAVYSAINRISSDMAMIPIQVKRREKDGSKRVVDDHPVAKVLSSSWDHGQTNAFFSKRQVMGYCLGWGQSISIIESTRWGEVTGLQHHHPQYGRAYRDSNGQLYYIVMGLNNQVKELPPEKVLHFKNYACCGDNGDSPLLIGRPALALYTSAEAYAQTTYSNGGNMRGYLMTDQDMTVEEVEAYLSAMVDEHGGVTNANKIGLLQGGMKWMATSFSPEAAQLVASRTFAIQDVCRLFSLPPHKLAEMSSSTFGNIEEQNRQYVDMTLMSWITMIEAECNLKLFSQLERDAGYCVMHDLEVLLRGNALAQAQADREYVTSGIKSVNEPRARLGLPPVDGGDAHIIQSNQATLEQIVSGKTLRSNLPASTSEVPINV
ncbi:phage portal protein [Paludisphaera borealis]|uniref:phage portal protein n=1 Tax=Paludisphaera borealis TaxID=1387353 RepID=UPI00143D03B3|nr:phage portal protein [Paludisphaera borealis]